LIDPIINNSNNGKCLNNRDEKMEMTSSSNKTKTLNDDVVDNNECRVVVVGFWFQVEEQAVQ
jgi:hypothetical protein